MNMHQHNLKSHLNESFAADSFWTMGLPLKFTTNFGLFYSNFTYSWLILLV